MDKKGKGEIGYQNLWECIECSETFGDINNDGLVNVLDIVAIVGIILGN